MIRKSMKDMKNIKSHMHLNLKEVQSCSDCFEFILLIYIQRFLDIF